MGGVNALRTRRALLIFWMVAGSLLVAGIVCDRVIAHHAYQGVPRGTVVDYAEPLAVRVMIAAGFWGLIAVALAGIVLYLMGKLRPEE
jgi:hypothetical protein